AALRDACVASEDSPTLIVNAVSRGLEVRLGKCSLSEPWPFSSDSVPLLAALAGPDWMTVVRRPNWIGERWVVWPVLALVFVRVAATWWGAGLPSAVAISALLLGAAFRMPVAAVLTYPLALLIGVVAAALRAAALVLRWLPTRTRVPAVFMALA